MGAVGAKGDKGERVGIPLPFCQKCLIVYITQIRAIRDLSGIGMSSFK